MTSISKGFPGAHLNTDLLNNSLETRAKALGAEQSGKTKFNGKNLTEANSVQARVAEAEKVAKEFETLFMDLVLKQMRTTAKPEDMSNAHEIYQGMLDEQYTKTMTDTHEFGIRSLILDWMASVDPGLKEEMKSAAKHYASQNLDPANSLGVNAPKLK